MSREFGAARRRPIEEFSYSNEEWSLLQPFIPDEKAGRVRRYIEETAAPEYLIAIYTKQSSERELAKRAAFERVAKAARALKSELESLENFMSGYLATQPDSFDDLADEVDDDERESAELWCKEFDHHLEQLSFYDRIWAAPLPGANAFKGPRRLLMRRLLSIWKGTLGMYLPPGGGRGDGPTARFVFAAASPLMQLGGERLGEIIPGQGKSALQEEIRNAQTWSKVEKKEFL